MEHGTNRESDEPMYLHVAYASPDCMRKQMNTNQDLVVPIQKKFRVPRPFARIS